MRFGVNYVPRERWFYQWHRLDRDSVARDLEAIASLGVDHVRLFPLWELLQPNRGLISSAAIADVMTMVDQAAAVGLTSSVDVFQGHLSSFDFIPAWISTWHKRNMFTDPQVLEAQSELVEELALACRENGHVDGLSLGNEVFQFAASRHPDTAEVSPSQAQVWVEKMLLAARKQFPVGKHTVSFDDDLLFEPDQPFGPRVGLTTATPITIHSWIFSRLGPALGPDHPRLRLFARYLLELAKAWAREFGVDRPLWLQEVGAPLNYLSAAQVPEFISQTIEQAMKVDGLEAITWWCSHDVNRKLKDFPEVEYDLGLFDSDGKLKPAGRAYAEAISIYKTVQAKAEQPANRPQPVIGIPSPDCPQARVAVRANGEIFSRWAQAIEDGKPAALVVDGE